MKRHLLLLLFIVTTSLSFGENNYQDVVYLKNGSIIRGVIIEQIPNQSIKIETKDNNVFFFEIDKIAKFTKEKPSKKAKVTREKSGLSKGYRGIVEFGYLFGVNNNSILNNSSQERLRVNIINGYQFNPYFSVGIGTGLRYYYEEQQILIPVFADFRANFMNYKISPYMSLGIGYSFNITSGIQGSGLLINPEVGVNYKISTKISLHAGIGYELQRKDIGSEITRESSNDPGYTSLLIGNAGAVSLHIGMSF